jgi:hypothetical protein
MDSLERLVTQINNGWTRNVPIDFSCEGNELSGVITAVVTGHSGDGEVLVLAEDGHLYLVELPERIGRLSKKACGCTDDIPGEHLRREGDEDAYTDHYQCADCGDTYTISTIPAME